MASCRLGFFFGFTELRVLRLVKGRRVEEVGRPGSTDTFVGSRGIMST